MANQTERVELPRPEISELDGMDDRYMIPPIDQLSSEQGSYHWVIGEPPKPISDSPEQNSDRSTVQIRKYQYPQLTPIIGSFYDWALRQFPQSLNFRHKISITRQPRRWKSMKSSKSRDLTPERGNPQRLLVSTPPPKLMPGRTHFMKW